MLKLACLALASAVLSGVGTQAVAQPAVAQPGSPLIIDRNRTDRRPPTPAPRPPSPTGNATAASEAHTATAFVLRDVRITGGSAPSELIRAAYRPFLGKTVDTAALARLTDAVAGAYGGGDVALYSVLLPNQTFANGVVHLQVVEGFVQTIQVDAPGAAARNANLVRRFARPLLNERPLRKSSLQRAVLLIRDVPGLKADVQFLRGAGPGAVVLQVALKAKRFELGIGANNRGTAELGRTQVEVDLTANSLIRPGDQTRFTVVAPTDIRRFQYYALSHSELLTDGGLSVAANFGYLRTRPASIPLHGTAETAGLALAYPVLRSNTRNVTVSGSIDGVNSNNALFGQMISDDHTRAARVTAAYSLTLSKVTFVASGAASFGLDILDAKVTSPLLSDRRFKKINGRVGLDDQVSPQWAVRLRGIGQYSGDRLPAVEQLALGGDEFGRAFESAVIIGDSGAAGSVEVAYSPKRLPPLVKGSEVYGFLDGGKLWSQDRTIIPSESQSLSSTGFGARLAVANKAVFQVEAAQALENPLPNSHDGWRVVFGYRSLY